MKEYVIHAKVKNNLILKRILDECPNVAQWCEKHGFSPSIVGEFINLKQSAMTKDLEWRLPALQIADALGVLPDEIFTEEQKERAIKANEVFVEMSRQQVLDYVDPLQSKELTEAVDGLLKNANLSNQEHDV